MSKDLAVITQELAELRSMVVQEKANRLNDSLFSKELAPHYMQLAGQLAKSEMVPKAYRGKPQDLFVAMAMGYQIGLSVEQSIQAIAVINGKPCLWGDDMLALCMNHPEFVDIIEEPIISQNNQVMGYRCTVKRKGMADHTEEFDLNKAKKAGLLGKPGVWTQYPERMMQLRARGFALRNKFPDALKGLRSREEVEDYVEAEYTVVDDKSLSRTELLKKDFLTKTGRLDAEEVEANVDNVQNQSPENANPEGEGVSEVAQDGEETADLHSEIRRLIDEKQVTEERVSKALKYYEVKSIDDLTVESSEDFLEKLNKL
jgi:hypothetical protein